MMSLTSLLVIALVMIPLFQNLFAKSLIEIEEVLNSKVSKSVARVFKRDYAELFQLGKADSADRVIHVSLPPFIDKDINNLLDELSVTAFLVMNIQGNVVYSPDKMQIGQDHSHDVLFQQALKGMSASSLDSDISYFDVLLGDQSATFLTSLVPVKHDVSGNIIGVVQMSFDISAMRSTLLVKLVQLVLLVLLFMAGFYSLYLFFMRKMDSSVLFHASEIDKLRNQSIQYLLEHDHLTGLKNREGFFAEIQKKIDEHLSDKYVCYLVRVDIQNFKLINRLYGNAVGDQLLIKFADRLRKYCVEDSFLARMEGDVFCAFMQRHYKEDFEQLMRNLFEVLSEKYTGLLDQPLEIKVSGGISVYPLDSNNAYQLYTEAETASLTAHAKSVNSAEFYHRISKIDIFNQIKINEDLANVIPAEDFELIYQPVLMASTKRVKACEALLRWKKEAGVSPELILYLLEKTKFFHDVTVWILETACSDCKSWHDDGFKNLSVSINISLPELLHPTFVEDVEQAIKQAGISASHVQLEFSEKSLITGGQSDHVMITMNKLKRLGVTIIVDNFGISNASLSHLLKYPIDDIKVDKSIIQGMLSHDDKMLMTKVSFAIAKAAGLGIIAQGVDAGRQMKVLEDMACDEVQGFLLARPMPQHKISNFLHNS